MNVRVLRMGFLCGVGIALGQQSSKIDTDRPSFTLSASTVPRGTVQFENGILASSDQQQRTIDFPETLIRIGILSSTEFRLTAPDYYHDAITPSGIRSGFSSLQIGVKRELLQHERFAAVAVATLIPPTGSSRISGDHYEGSLQIAWSDELSKQWKIGGSASVYSRTQNGLNPATGESTFVVFRNLTESWTVFAEYGGDFPARGGPMHTAHMGTTYKLTRNQQIDFHSFVGLSSAAVNHAFGAGYSFRFR